MPLSTLSALVRAFAAPAAFLDWQGTSTSPAIGSQTRPSIFDSAIDAASRLCCGVPPNIATAAAAAIAEAEPTSAWQPASAPATEALRISRQPIAPAVKSPLRTVASSSPNSSSSAKRTAGSTPDGLKWQKIQDIYDQEYPKIVNADSHDAAMEEYDKMISEMNDAGLEDVEKVITQNYQERMKLWNE